MVYKNQQVADAWAKGRRATGLNMYTDGKDIYSYWLRIGKTASNGDKLAFDYSAAGGWFYSMSTSKHCSYVKRAAHSTINSRNNPGDMETNYRKSDSKYPSVNVGGVGAI